MSKNPLKKTVEELFADNAIEVQVGDKAYKYSISQLYDDLPEKAKEIRKTLEEHCKGKSPQDVEGYLENAQRIFEERAFAKTRYENVLREELRIRDQELNPHKFDLAGFVNQASKQTDLRVEEGKRYKPSRDGFVAPNIVAPRMTGATPQEFEDILDGKTKAAFIGAPDKYYRNNVFDAEFPARDGIRINNKRLEVFLAEERIELTPEEDDACRKYSELKHKLSNAAQHIGATALDVTKVVGRGLISKTNAEETSAYKEYSDKRNDTIYDMLYKACPGEHRVTYFKALKARNAVLRSSGDANSIAMANEMDRELDAMLAKAEEEDKKRYKELQENIESGNKSTLAGLQGHVDKEDEAHKWTMLCAFLVLGPFAGGLAVAPILGNLLGPVLAGSGSFAQGVAALPTSSLFGPFGKLAEVCHLPDLIKGTLHHVPVFEQFTEIMEFALHNPVSAGVLEEMLPLASSPVVALGIAGLAATAGVSQQYLIYTDKQDHMKKKEDELKDMPKKFEKSGVTIQKNRSEEFVTRKIDASQRAYSLTKFAEFLADTDEASLTALGIDFKMDKKTPEKVMNFLLEQQKDPKSAGTLSKNFGAFLLYESLGRDKEKFAKTTTNEVEKKTAIEKQTKKFAQDCIFELAQSSGISGIKGNSVEQNYNFCRSKLITSELEKLKADGVSFNENPLIPRPVVEKPKAQELRGKLAGKSRGSQDDSRIGLKSAGLVHA